MDYSAMVKRLVVPDGAEVPRRLVHGEVIARAIGRDDLADDVRGINASLDLIRRTRGGEWPSGPVTEEYNYVDLVWHECEFRDGGSYTYVLRRADGSYLGCLYLYPLGTRTPLHPDILALDVDVSWWVTPDGYTSGYYTEVFTALWSWFTGELAFWVPHFSNREIPDPGQGGSGP